MRDTRAPISACFVHTDTNLCSDLCDTIGFWPSESCVVCGGGQVVQDIVQRLLSVTILCGRIVQIDLIILVRVIGFENALCAEDNSDNDLDFTSSEMCCGSVEVVNIKQRFASTPITTTSTPMHILAPTSTFSHDNENIAYDCPTQSPTSVTFTASSMCWRAVVVSHGIEEVFKVPQNHVVWTNMKTARYSMSQVVLCPTHSIRPSTVVRVVVVAQCNLSTQKRIISTAWVIRARTSLESSNTVVSKIYVPRRTTRLTSLQRTCVWHVAEERSPCSLESSTTNVR